MSASRNILDELLERSKANLTQPAVVDASTVDKIRAVVRCLSNRAGVRMLMTCMLVKIERPEVDIRKPYTEIGDPDCFSGRDYDQSYIGPFAAEHELPVNSTTAFLTPGFRTMSVPLAPPLVINGRPKVMYTNVIDILGVIHEGVISPEDALVEVLRQLLVLKKEQEERMQQLLAELNASVNGIPLSSENILALIEQHLQSPKSSRLPVLIVAAAYNAVVEQIGEKVKPLYSHTAADLQTGALGDVEVTLINEDNVVTSYEMKAKEITRSDIDIALRKVSESGTAIDNYIFITTHPINPEVVEYATSLYQVTGGIEFAVLDCMGFLRHFLHLFHRYRLHFLDAYQELILREPVSAVNQPLKEAFLALRRAAELDNSI